METLSDSKQFSIGAPTSTSSTGSRIQTSGSSQVGPGLKGGEEERGMVWERLEIAGAAAPGRAPARGLQGPL